MMMMSTKLHVYYLAVVAVTMMGFLWSSSESLRFDLASGHIKCITDEIKTNSMTVGKYSVVKPNEEQPLPASHRVTVRVTSVHGNNYHHGENVEEGQFAFTASEAGDYTVCFWAMEHHPEVTLTVDFDWRSGVAAKDWSSIAKKGSVDLMFIFTIPWCKCVRKSKVPRIVELVHLRNPAMRTTCSPSEVMQCRDSCSILHYSLKE